MRDYQSAGIHLLLLLVSSEFHNNCHTGDLLWQSFPGNKQFELISALELCVAFMGIKS